jgi:hypothetical protein
MSCPRLVLSTFFATLACFTTACYPLGGTEATPEVCVDAWNRGSNDGLPVPEGELNISTWGRGFGFIARRAAVVSNSDCSIVFDLGGEVFEFHSVSAGEQAPFTPDNPGLAGWTPGQDVMPPYYLDRIDGSWNACQESDGTLVLLSDGACGSLRPGVRPPAIEEWLNRRAARSFVAARELMPPNTRRFWLGPRLRGSVAQVEAVVRGGPPISRSVPAGASFDATYYPWRGLPPWKPVGPRLQITALTYVGRVKRLPKCLERVPGSSRCVEPFRPLLRLERNGQTVIVVAANADRIPASLVQDIRRSLTEKPGYSEARLEATEHQDSLAARGGPFGRRG